MRVCAECTGGPRTSGNGESMASEEILRAKPTARSIWQLKARRLSPKLSWLMNIFIRHGQKIQHSTEMESKNLAPCDRFPDI